MTTPCSAMRANAASIARSTSHGPGRKLPSHAIVPPRSATTVRIARAGQRRRPRAPSGRARGAAGRASCGPSGRPRRGSSATSAARSLARPARSSEAGGEGAQGRGGMANGGGRHGTRIVIPAPSARRTVPVHGSRLESAPPPPPTSGEQNDGDASMADRDGWIWYDGKLVPWRDATTHVLTHSLHYGLAVFEGVRAYKTVGGTAIFRLKEHTDRLFNSAHIYMMKIPYTARRLMAAQKEVVRANKLESCYIRPIAFYGSEKMGVSPEGREGARRDRRLAVGRLPRRRRPGEGHPRQDLVVRAPPRQRLDVPRQVLGHLRQLDPRQRSRRPSTATTRACCSTWTASSPKARARTCSSSRTARSTSRS